MLALVLAAEIHSLTETPVLHFAEGESIYPRICRRAAVAGPREGVVLSMAASGALEYYTALTYARWDWLEPGGLRLCVTDR